MDKRKILFAVTLLAAFVHSMGDEKIEHIPEHGKYHYILRIRKKKGVETSWRLL